jgi:hypothetical protein
MADEPSKITVGTNSWISRADADTYFQTRFGAGKIWREDLDQDAKEASLVTAYKNLVNCGLFTFPETATTIIKEAQCEYALFLLQHGEDIDSRLGLIAQGVVSSGVVQETYDIKIVNGIPIPNLIRSMLSGCSTLKPMYGFKLQRDDDTEKILDE